MQLHELIGYLAACLTTCSFVPQALHTFRTRDVSGISLGMYSVFTVGVALWLAYGLAHRGGQCHHPGPGRHHPGHEAGVQRTPS